MSDLLFLFRVSRPRFWFYLCGPYLVGLAAGAAEIRLLTDWRYLLFAIYFLFPANLLVYGINDIFDYDTDRLNDKKSGYEDLVGPAKQKLVLVAVAAANLPFIVAAAIYLTPVSLSFLIGFLLLGVFYSSPPIRAKTKPLLDSAFNFLYVMPAVVAYSFTAGHVPAAAIMIGAGLWTAAMHAYSAIPDIKADQAAGIPTIATLLGHRGTHYLCVAAYGVAGILVFPYLGILAVVATALYLSLMFYSLTIAPSTGIFNVYRRFPTINVCIGAAIFWYVAFLRFA